MTRKETIEYLKKTKDIELLRFIVLENLIFLNLIWIAKQIERKQNETNFKINR